MSEEQKSLGVVTALSVVGLVFGLIGMLGSFIPCIGSMAYFVGIPAAVVSGIGLFIAQQKDSYKSLAVAALTISLIGVVISGVQSYKIRTLGERAQQEVEALSNPRFEERQIPTTVPQSASTKTPAASAVPLAENSDTQSALVVRPEIENKNVENFIKSLYDSYRSESVEKYMSHIHESAVLKGQKYVLRGKAEIQQQRTKTFSNLKDFSFQFKSIVVTVSGNYADVQDELTLSYTAKKSGNRLSENIKEKFKLVKEDGRWLVLENTEY